MAKPYPHAVRPVVEVQRRLNRAADEQLAQVLALVDAMPDRGDADALIAPLRPRLAGIAPVRPMSLTRLLFRPLDAVIVPGPRWRAGTPAVPRTALPSIGNAVVTRLGPAASSVQAMIAGHDGQDPRRASAAGAFLWPAAAAALRDMPAPPDWGLATGLPTGCYPEIRNNVVAVLLQAVAIVDIPTDPAGPDATPAAKAILTATQDHQPGGVGIVVAVLLANGVTAAPVLAAALRLPGAQVDPAIEQTLDRAQHVLTTVLPSVGLEPAFLQATQIASLLDAVDGPLARPPLRAQAQRTRVLADQACQGRLIQALDQDFLPKLAAANAVLDDGALMALEGVARGVRRLSLVGRRLGDGAVYDKLLSRTAAGAFASSNTLTRMERLRLAELLVGADAALRLAQVPVG